MQPIKHFSIFKNKEVKNDKMPTHSISTKIGEEFVNIGACWTKDSKGGKYLSCKLQDVYVDHTDRTKIKKGFAIVEEKVGKQDEDNEQPPDDSVI